MIKTKNNHLLLITLMLMGCMETNVPVKNNGVIINDSYIKETNIDSCQYLYTLVQGGISLTHKGNCNNEIHKQN